MTDSQLRPESREPTGRTYAPDFLTELFRNPLDPGYADAAARRQLGAAVRWRRSVRAVSLIVLVVLGLLFAVAYRQTVAAAPGRQQAREGLVAQIEQRESETDQLSERADELRVEVARQRAAALGTEAEQLHELEAGTGLGRVSGDGVVVRLADAPPDQQIVSDPALGPPRVIYLDLQGVANGLWASGAEAISINGQRLTATSTIRSAGQAILVDFRPVTGPYEVSAIGSDELRERFAQTRIAATMQQVAADTGVAFEVRDADDLALPAAPDPRLQYAQPPASPTPSGRPVSPGASGSPTAPDFGGSR
ncbi:DUF881 domain-containing protein [Salinispora fenicalii]|uniref:DUF881 domain-containing protein n=1 Tax=Salinispora fenicalii TaxID=1137263 RepID=UPI000481C419|nr:DUF881 domain-containing protein [Salinispora fenicalii]